MLMVQEWRNLLLLKRKGRGLSKTGVAGTTQGELAVNCRPCPFPGRNIPENLGSSEAANA